MKTVKQKYIILSALLTCILTFFIVGAIFLFQSNIVVIRGEDAQTDYISVTLDSNGGDIKTTLKGLVGQSVALPIPKRDGYVFKGWRATNYASNAQIGNLGSLDCSSRNSDPFFLNNIEVGPYSPRDKSKVTLTKVAVSSELNISPNSKNILQIATTTTDLDFFGGFYQGTMTAPNKEFVVSIQAKIPIGYSLQWSSNTGTIWSDKRFLNSNIGTGDWESYYVHVKCNSNPTVTYLDTNYFYLQGASNSAAQVTYYIANTSVYDATGLNLERESIIENLSTTTTYTFGTSNQTLWAVWESDTWEKYSQQPQLNSDGFYAVEKPAQLAWFAYKAKFGNLDNCKIKLMNDIDLLGHYWLPIGVQGDGHGFTNASFFNGNGFKIKNLSINVNKQNSDYAYIGLIGYAENIIITNLIIESGMIISDTSLRVTGLIGELQNGIISNCQNYASIHTSGSGAGIVGRNVNGKIENCINYGQIVGELSVGGIAATSNGLIQNCTNMGEIVIPSNINLNSAAGGIVGTMQTKSNTLFCTNYGDILGNAATGGIVGIFDDYTEIVNCTNYGNIKTLGTGAGGIVGRDVCGQYLNCINYGDVTASSNAGGMIGYKQDGRYGHATYLTNCINAGRIVADSQNAGGLIGKNYSFEMANCFNFGDVASLTNAGGLVGYIVTDNNPIIIKGCLVESEVFALSGTGGFIGNLNINTLLVSDCAFTGLIQKLPNITNISATIGSSSASADLTFINIFVGGHVDGNFINSPPTSFKVIDCVFNYINNTGTVQKGFYKENNTSIFNQDNWTILNGSPFPKVLVWNNTVSLSEYDLLEQGYNQNIY